MVLRSLAMLLLLAGISTTQEQPYRRTSKLLDFETETDLVFASGAHVDAAQGHASPHCASIAKDGLTIKVGSLLSGREFPGTWTLLGLYIRSETARDARLSLLNAGKVLAERTVNVRANTWCPAMLDLTTTKPTAPDDLTLRVQLTGDGSAWVDDVILADNSVTFVDTGKSGWSVRKRGFEIIVETPSRSVTRLPSEEVEHGWKVLEANAIRVRFEAGGSHQIYLYQDGRTFSDVEPHLLSAKEDAPPGKLDVSEEEGRVERNSEGDADHDGYNESTGAYRIVATAGRKIDVTLAPANAGQKLPAGAVLEVRGLAAGQARVTVEGRLLDDVVRLNDGTLLARLPVTVERDTIIGFRIQ